MEGKKNQLGSSFASDLFGAKVDSSAPPDSSYFRSIFHLPPNPTEADKKSNQAPPFHYSSSIYYGGQDVYSQPQTAQDPARHTTFSKEIGEDNEGKASRGNWWQGSLYY